MSILTKVIYRFNEIAFKIPVACFTALEQNNTKIHMEAEMTKNNQGNPEGKEQSCGHLNAKSQDYYGAVAPETSWYWHKKQYIDRAMEQTRETRDESTHLQPTDL